MRINVIKTQALSTIAEITNQMIGLVGNFTNQQAIANAQAGSVIGRNPVDTRADISTPGFYIIMTGTEAGQVWEKLEDNSVIRRPELEAASYTNAVDRKELGLPFRASLDLTGNTPNHIALQSFIDAQYAERRKDSNGQYETNFEKEHIPVITLPEGVINLQGPITVPRKAKLHGPNTVLKVTSNLGAGVGAVTLGIGSELEIDTIEFLPALTQGHGIVANRDCKIKGKVVLAPENAIHGSVTNYYGGVPAVEGPYGSHFDVTTIAARGYGIYLPLQANSITGKAKIFSSGLWGFYVKEANALDMFLDLEGNTGGGLRVVSSDASKFYLYCEGNGQASHPSNADANDVSSSVWIGPETVGAVVPTNVTLSGYIFSGHVSLNPARNLIRLTGARNLNLTGLKVWVASPQPDSTGILLDNTFDSYVGDSDLTGVDFVVGDKRDIFNKGNLPIRDAKLKYKDSRTEFYRGVNLVTDYTERNIGIHGAWNNGHLILGNAHVWVNRNEKLRYKNGAPTHGLDGYPITMEELWVNITQADTEVAIPHYQYDANVKWQVVNGGPIVPVGSPPIIISPTRPADATYVYLKASAPCNFNIYVG